jgi:hypothetical protein
MDDEDEFVDAVEERDEESGANDENKSDAPANEEDGFGDDDFGDFGDFAAEQGDDDNEVHEEYDPELEERTQRIGHIPSQEQERHTPTTSPKPPLVHPNEFHLIVESPRR